METTTMQDVQFIVGFDHNARFIHLFHAETADLPIDCEELVGESLGTYAANDSDARLLRATLAECLFWDGGPRMRSGGAVGHQVSVPI
jgi:hypothetical protein